MLCCAVLCCTVMYCTVALEMSRILKYVLQDSGVDNL